ncbi:uncharacterized protein EKO05_0003417 [Ascochyta rabiei]|uniref:uncharacterized protein n=1 Tax=Didymella rabiei TaxID=5454 RepID=UPI00220647A6|nr:uncharacterized protein EKO05_0003417 [Ascochyta rabiei]UPX12882.1 hypothetical protein EKO05_0003417 [Ascochyta rabiei]
MRNHLVVQPSMHTHPSHSLHNTAHLHLSLIIITYSNYILLSLNMPDGSNNGTSPLSNSARRLLLEFPISSHSLFNQDQSAETAIHDSTVSDRLEALGQEVQSLARELSEERQRQLELQLQLDILVAQPAPTGGASSIPVPVPGNVARPNIPIHNLFSILPKVTYTEQHEEEFERSLEYIGVQRKILRALDRHDTVLTAKAAYTWTRASAPNGRLPRPKHALRLCYYMRSLGYDTFASVKNIRDSASRVTKSMLRLLVANPNSETRGVGYDYLYWMQYIGSGAVVPKPYKALSHSRPHLGSRGCFVADALDMERSFPAELINAQLEEVGSEPVHIRGGEAQPSHPLHPGEDAEEGRAAYVAPSSPH